MSLITVVETAEFLKFEKDYLTEEERNALINYLAENPKDGVLIQGTGGLRKIRWNR